MNLLGSRWLLWRPLLNCIRGNPTTSVGCMVDDFQVVIGVCIFSLLILAEYFAQPWALGLGSAGFEVLC